MLVPELSQIAADKDIHLRRLPRSKAPPVPSPPWNAQIAILSLSDVGSPGMTACAHGINRPIWGNRGPHPARQGNNKEFAGCGPIGTGGMAGNERRSHRPEWVSARFRTHPQGRLARPQKKGQKRGEAPPPSARPLLSSRSTLPRICLTSPAAETDHAGSLLRHPGRC